MKKVLKIIALIIAIAALLVYAAFLFVLPKKLDLNIYKSQIQKLAEEYSHLSLDFDNIQLVTTPLLEAGVKINDINVKLPDGSELFNADGMKAKVSLPNLLLLTVRVSEVVIDNPQINVEIAEDGSQYKLMSIIERIINEQKQKQEAAPPVETKTSWFNPAWIKIKVPNINLNNYALKINDLKSKHYLTLRGENLAAAFYNMKTFKVKTYAEFLSDENVNMTAKIDLNSFIPPARELDEEDDPDYRADMGFVNPVLLYRDYNLKTDISAKIKARLNSKGQIVLHGNAAVENLTMHISDYQLPKSFFRVKLNGDSANVDTNLYIAHEKNITVTGNVNYSKHPKLDLNINSKKIYFNDLIALTKAFMDTLRIKNDLASMQGSGYIAIHSNIKTNFKKLKSSGAIVIRDGAIINNKAGLLLKDINANVIFKGKSLELADTHLVVNDSELKAEGTIDEKSVANISLYAEKLPLAGLFAAFAPVDAKKAYNLNSGNLFLDAKISGELKKAVSNIKMAISNLDLATKDNSMRITDGNLNAKFTSNFKTITGQIANKNLNIYLNPSNSVISNPDLNVVIDEENITLNPLSIKINNSSVINASGQIAEYMKHPFINLNATGKLHALDLKQILGKEAAPFINANGVIPMKLVLSGDTKRQDLTCQLKADKLNYITPIDIQSVKGRQSIIQSKISFKGDRLNIKDTGLYIKPVPTPFVDDFDANMEGAQEITSISGTITKLDTPEPFINQINIKFPKDLKVQLCAFKNSVLDFGGNLVIYGQSAAPKYRGGFFVKNMVIPDLLIALKDLQLGFVSHNLILTIQDLLLNGSDIQVTADANLVPAPIFTVNNLRVTSSNLDIPKMLAVSEAAMKYAPPAKPNSEPADIPVVVRNGSIEFQHISSPPVVLENTTGEISLRDNIFYLHRLLTTTLGARVTGDISANLVTMLLRAQVQGTNFDVERTFFELMNMKDTLSGTMSFSTDLTINGAAKTQAEQMKGINGDVDFEIIDGQLGPFGRLENLILAENIRESEFFQTALGGVIDSLTSVETSHFDRLNGHIEMDNGTAKLNPIASSGKVMCMHIAGDMNLLTNEADMKLRAKLGSQIANMLGPIAAVNPINLVKATPGLNVAAAKMFAIFCEQITKEELAQIPDFRDEFSSLSTTNFQVVLRGDTTKPLSLIKSFKWLATSDDIANAENFVNTLPPTDPENPNATLEELLAAQAEAERIANENILQKAVRKTGEFFVNFKKEK